MTSKAFRLGVREFGEVNRCIRFFFFSSEIALREFNFREN